MESHFFSPLSEILLNDGEDINIDDLLKSIDKKPITNFLPIHESDCKRVDVIDTKKPFPYLSRRTICEWKSFFRTFCSREERISAKFSHDIPNNIAIENCYKKFLDCLRKSFIMNIIVEIRELGYVTQT